MPGTLLSASASQLLHASPPQTFKTRLEGWPRLHQIHGHGILEPPWRSSSKGSLIMEPRVVAFTGATSSTSKNVRIAQMAQSSHVHSLCPPSRIAQYLHVVGLKQGGFFSKAFHHRWKSLGRCWHDEKGHYRSIVVAPWSS